MMRGVLRVCALTGVLVLSVATLLLASGCGSDLAADVDPEQVDAVSAPSAGACRVLVMCVHLNIGTSMRLCDPRTSALAAILLAGALLACGGGSEPPVPDNITIAFHCASALHKSGDDSSAKEILQSLLKTGEPFAEKAAAGQLLSGLSP